MIRTIERAATLIIGDDCGISGGSIVCQTSVTIGNGVLIGANCVITDTDFHEIHTLNRRYAPPSPGEPHHAVGIGNNVFLGTSVIVLKGVTIDDNTVVAAGAVVSNDLPADCIAAGIPARPVRSLRISNP